VEDGRLSVLFNPTNQTDQRTMNESTEYLVISRGQWDPAVSREDIQIAIDQFYDWLQRRIDEGKMRSGERLGTQGKTVYHRKITDGPFGEAKEVIGGYWFIVAHSLEEAAAIAAENPCLKYGLVLEIRPLELQRASAFRHANETPPERKER
jgi:hypothetical protein